MKKSKLLKYLLISFGVLVVLGVVVFCIFMMWIRHLTLGPGVQDFTYKLSGGYMLSRSSANTIMVIPKNGSWNDTIPTIPEKVIEIAWDKHFILAKRQGLQRRSPENPNDTYMEPDDSVFDYWILDVSLPKVYGPLTREEFENKRMELFVSNELVLKDIYQYK